MDEKVFEGLSRGGEEGQRAIAELLQVKAAELGALGKALLERTSGLVVSKQELRARQKKLDDEHTKLLKNGAGALNPPGRRGVKRGASVLDGIRGEEPGEEEEQAAQEGAPAAGEDNGQDAMRARGGEVGASGAAEEAGLSGKKAPKQAKGGRKKQKTTRGAGKKAKEAPEGAEQGGQEAGEGGDAKAHAEVPVPEEGREPAAADAGQGEAQEVPGSAAEAPEEREGGEQGADVTFDVGVACGEDTPTPGPRAVAARPSPFEAQAAGPANEAAASGTVPGSSTNATAVAMADAPGPAKVDTMPPPPPPAALLAKTPTSSRGPGGSTQKSSGSGSRKRGVAAAELDMPAAPGSHRTDGPRAPVPDRQWVDAKDTSPAIKPSQLRKVDSSQAPTATPPQSQTRAPASHAPTPTPSATPAPAPAPAAATPQHQAAAEAPSARVTRSAMKRSPLGPGSQASPAPAGTDSATQAAAAGPAPGAGDARDGAGRPEPKAAEGRAGAGAPPAAPGAPKASAQAGTAPGAAMAAKRQLAEKQGAKANGMRAAEKTKERLEKGHQRRPLETQQGKHAKKTQGALQADKPNPRAQAGAGAVTAGPGPSAGATRPGVTKAPAEEASSKTRQPLAAVSGNMAGGKGPGMPFKKPFATVGPPVRPAVLSPPARGLAPSAAQANKAVPAQAEVPAAAKAAPAEKPAAPALAPAPGGAPKAAGPARDVRPEDEVQEYPMSPYHSDSEESEEGALKKPVPQWARSYVLKETLHEQRKVDPDTVFRCPGGSTCDLEVVFDYSKYFGNPSDPRMAKKRHPRQRTSSGNWAADCPDLGAGLA